MEVKNVFDPKRTQKFMQERRKLNDQLCVSSVSGWRSAENPNDKIFKGTIPKEWPKPMSTIECLKFDVIHYSNRFKNFATKCLQKIHVYFLDCPQI